MLQKDKEHAKDLSVWHQALVLPQLIATPLGGVVRDYFQQVGCSGKHVKVFCFFFPHTTAGKKKCEHCAVGYVMLFVLTAIYFVCSGMFVVRIKKIL